MGALGGTTRRFLNRHSAVPPGLFQLRVVRAPESGNPSYRLVKTDRNQWPHKAFRYHKTLWGHNK